MIYEILFDLLLLTSLRPLHHVVIIIIIITKVLI